MSDAVILVCPCCASTVDAVADEDPQTFHCTTCGQTWTQVVQAARYEAHSLY